MPWTLRICLHSGLAAAAVGASFEKLGFQGMLIPKRDQDVPYVYAQTSINKPINMLSQHKHLHLLPRSIDFMSGTLSKYPGKSKGNGECVPINLNLPPTAPASLKPSRGEGVAACALRARGQLFAGASVALQLLGSLSWGPWGML